MSEEITSLLPGSGTLTGDLEFETQPSYTYAMHLDAGSISGMTDKQVAMRQAIYKILHTERYTYPVYSWDYGIELMDLFGKPTPYCEVELERRIKEALEWDDRINKVDNFVFSYPQDKNTIRVEFTAHTIYGDVDSDYDFGRLEEETTVTDPLCYVEGTTLVFTWRASVGVNQHTLCLNNPAQFRISGTTLAFGD